MEVLTVVGILAGLFAVIYGFFTAVERLNDHAVQHYAFKPITAGTVFAISPAWFFLIVALTTDGASNVVAASALMTMIILGSAWYVSSHTSATVGALSVVLLVILGIFAASIILWVISLIFKDERHHSS